MNGDYLEHINEAHKIAVSGRADIVGDRILKAFETAQRNADDMWKVQVVGGLYNETNRNYNALKAACSDPKPDVALVCWRARNLLELMVWAKFCAEDPKNLRRFFDDAGNDSTNLLKAFERTATATKITLPDMSQSRDELRRKALARGVSTIDGPFLPVLEAAQAIKIDAHYSLFNKYFSKFAHPTSILIVGDGETFLPMRDSAIGLGSMYYVHSFIAIEEMSMSLSSQAASA